MLLPLQMISDAGDQPHEHRSPKTSESSGFKASHRQTRAQRLEQAGQSSAMNRMIEQNWATLAHHNVGWSRSGPERPTKCAESERVGPQWPTKATERKKLGHFGPP